MNFLQKIFKSENFWPLFIVIVAGILAGRSLIFESGYFNMHDDLQMMRQLEMEKCFLDGQIPCRWVPDMGYGYGFPLFNFYPPLPYLVGQVFRLAQIPFVDTVKLTFALAFIASGVTMYFLAKQFFGKWGGVVSAIFYIWAPYHSVDIYIRGAMNESWALVFFPAILLTSYKLISENSKSPNLQISKKIGNWKLEIGNCMWIIPLAVSWAGLLLSHNVMALIFLPVFACWCFMFWVRDRDWSKFLAMLVSGLLTVGLVAFFTLPAIFEQKFTHVDTLVQGYYEFIAHYGTIGQLLLSRYWGFGPSIWGPKDGMPFQIGQIHWLLSLIILVLLIVNIFKKKLKIPIDSLLVILFSIVFAWFAAFMVHQYSTPIWQLIKPLAFVQFPWRFLTLVILGFSLLSGSIVLILKPYRRLVIIIPTVLVVLLLIINWTYFAPQFGKMGPLTDDQKFSGLAWNMQRTAGIYDYLPKTAKQNPKSQQNTLAQVVKGGGVVANPTQGTNWAKFNVNLTEDSTVRVNLFEFPNWKIIVDGKVVKSYIPEEELDGRMYLGLSKGDHEVALELKNTPIRTVSNIISLVSWILLATYLLRKKGFSQK